MKKVLILFLLLMFVSPAFAQINNNGNSNSIKTMPNSVSRSIYQISVIDPTPETNRIGAFYPGLRGANQLIIYTPKFGERTGTNEFGKEVIVRNGIITDITGSNSPIPQDGFVISGHGRAKKWIDRYISVGAVINIDPEKNTITSTVVADSYIFNINQKIIRVKNLISGYKMQNRSYKANEANKFLKEAQDELKVAKEYAAKNDILKLKTTSAEAVKLADKALNYAISPVDNEFHGVWIRPKEKSTEDIAKTLDRIKSAGIDTVFLETYYQGYTIFPSKTLQENGVIPQRKEFAGFDPLKSWIEEAHKRKMKVFVWFQTFYVGNEDITKNPNHILSAHPDWANVQKKNAGANRPMPSIHEHNGYFLDPANPQVQNYLLSLLSEIACNYDIDGLNIDYIRYPVSLGRTFPNYVSTTWGYTNPARAEFLALYSVDPVNLTVNDPLWQKWIEYRQNKVTQFVSKLKDVTAGRNITISTVMFPDPEESAFAKLQNWSDWGNNCYVDAFTPLIMGSDPVLAEEHMDVIKNAVGNKVKVYAGLFEPFTAGTPADLLYQIKSVRDHGSAGVVIFDYSHLSQEFIDALNARAFKP